MFRFKRLLRFLTVGFWIIPILSISPVSAAEKFAPAGSKQVPEIFVQLGHGGSTTITSIVFSPDGRYILSGGGDKAIKLWETATGREVRTLREHSDSIGQVVFSGDGKFALSKDSRSLIQWDIFTGKIVKKSKVFPFLSAFTSDGKYTIVGEEGMHDISLWDTATGKKIKTLKDNRNFPKNTTSSIDVDVYAFSVSGNNRYAISSHQPGILKIWDLSSGKVVKELKNENVQTSIYIAVSHTGKFFLSAGFGKDEKMSLVLWDMEKGKVIRTVFTCVSGGSAFGVFSPDEKYILFSKVNNEKGEFFLCLEKLETGREVWCSEGHSSYITSAAFAPDGKSVITGGWDHTLKLWDIATGKNTRTFSGDITFSSFGYSPRNNHMLAGSSIWDMSVGKIILTFQGVDAAYLMLSPDGQSILAKEQKLLFNIETGKWTGVFPEEQGDVSWKTVFSPDGRYILHDFEGTLKLWDIGNAKTVRIFKAHDSFPGTEAMTFSPDGKFILSGGLDNNQSALKLWDANNGRNIWSVKLSNIRASSLDFSPDGKHILLGDGVNNMPVLYNAANGRKIKEFKHSDIYRSRIECVVAFSPDGKYALSADRHDNRIVLWDIGTGKEVKIFEGHSSGVDSIAFLQDGKRFLSKSYDGTTRLWDINTGNELAQFISFTDGEWVVITPEGYFNASPNGAKHLNVRVGNNVYSIDNFYEKFFNPVYVASVLQGKKVEAVADIRKGILTPPDVTITSPEPNSSFSTDTVIITVSAKDTGGGIDEIRLYHNGKAIGEDTRAVKIVPKPVPASSKQGGNEVIKTYTVALVDGLNTFRAIAFSKDRTESNPYELIVKLTAPQKDVSMYIFAVGINKYKNPALNLNYAEPDAKGIVDFFKQKGKGLFKNVELREIYNEHATKENITAKLKQLENTNPQDAVLIYLAGHGENMNDKWYFIPHEITYPEREDEVKTKGISSDELSGLIKNISAQKILLLIDACKAGAVLIAFRGFEDRKALSQLSRSTGVHIIAASTKDQFAAEVKDLGHGVFTYILLEGLKGKAAGKGETVTVRKLMGYIEEKLPDITKKYKQEAQYPVVDSRGMDFPLVIAK